MLSRELLERFMEPFKLLGAKCAEGTEGVINARKRRPIGSNIEVCCARGNKLVQSVSISLGLQDWVITITYGGGVFIKEHFVKIIGK